MRIIDDTTAADWIGPLGMSYGEYVEPVFRMLVENGWTWKNQEQLWRDDFLKRAAEGSTDETLTAFYCGRVYGQYQVAAQMPRDNLLQSLIEEGQAKLPSLGLAEMAEKTEGRFVFFDHGCGSGSVGLAVAERYPEATVLLYDYRSPGRQVLANAFERYVEACNVSLCWVAPVGGTRIWERLNLGFDYIHSRSVFEHLLDPIGELHSLVKYLRQGGLAYIDPFFGSDGGRDPSHLAANEHFGHHQEWALVIQEQTTLEPLVQESGKSPVLFRKTK